ncbi:MAG: dTMP kinase [Phycisphaerae bacterium]
MHHLAGKFIVFDGPEGCGKSTQARRLRDDLEAVGVCTELIRDPGTTAIGEKVRHILLDPASEDMAARCEMLLFMAARAQMNAERIAPALADGKCVICDRFVSSTLAYQLGGDGLSGHEIRQVAAVALRGRLPDLTLLFDLPVEESLVRMRPKFAVLFDGAQDLGKDRIEQRPESYHRQVRDNYLKQAQDFPEGYRVLDARPGIEVVAARVREVLMAIAD